jgi:RNA polymerase sigma-70 factor (ECF subfamily)
MSMRSAALLESDVDDVDQRSTQRLLQRRRDASIAAALPSSADLESQVFALVYRQMHALYGRWRGDFEDLAQAAVEQALRALPSFRRESELSTWTYRICYRAVLRHRRWYRRWLRRFTLDAPATEAVDAESAEVKLEKHERLARLANALDGLSEKRRAVVVLRDIEGLGIPAIAAIVGTSHATVRSRLRDARRKLAESLRADPYFGVGSSEEKHCDG